MVNVVIALSLGQYSVHSVPQYNSASLCRETVENSRKHLKVGTNYLTNDFEMGRAFLRKAFGNVEKRFQMVGK